MTTTTSNIVTEASEAKVVPVNLHVRKQTSHYVELFVQLAPEISRSEFAQWCDCGEVQFNGVELEDDTYGSVTRNGESIGWFVVSDWGGEPEPYRVLPTVFEPLPDVPGDEPRISYDGLDPP